MKKLSQTSTRLSEDLDWWQCFLLPSTEEPDCSSAVKWPLSNESSYGYLRNHYSTHNLALKKSCVFVLAVLPPQENTDRSYLNNVFVIFLVLACSTILLILPSVCSRNNRNLSCLRSEVAVLLFPYKRHHCCAFSKTWAK